MDGDFVIAYSCSKHQIGEDFCIETFEGPVLIGQDTLVEGCFLSWLYLPETCEEIESALLEFLGRIFLLAICHSPPIRIASIKRSSTSLIEKIDKKVVLTFLWRTTDINCTSRDRYKGGEENEEEEHVVFCSAQRASECVSATVPQNL